MCQGVTSHYNRRPCVHSLVKIEFQRICRYCHSKKVTNLACLQCGDVYFHFRSCFSKSHFPVKRWGGANHSKCLTLFLYVFLQWNHSTSFSLFFFTIELFNFFYLIFFTMEPLNFVFSMFFYNWTILTMSFTIEPLIFFLP